jgi:spore coat polysaccharide biosynthesis protein SpsF (cytidylyltransferase family)
MLESERELSHYRLTIDEEEDFALVARVFESLGAHARLADVIAFLDANPAVARLNRHLLDEVPSRQAA